ncbi:hypothetical protein [Haloechinothrix halophila]|uniref:hypothetical protein n=1 Tax=Haloechinothrix halophila TaxID=1069073 RepID=UPI00040BEBF3|nr:hypothetical protein [Haloechinothrix halophila]
MGRQRRGGSTQTPKRIEDVFSERVLSDPNVDRDYLNALLRDPSLLRVDEPAESATGAEDADDAVRNEPESTAARVAKLTCLILAVGLLCGSLVTAVFLDRHRTAEHRAAPPERQITGIAALAGFAMTTPPPETTAPVTERAATIAADDTATDTAASAEVEPGDAATSTPLATSSPTTRVGTAEEIDAFIRDFYHRFTEGPDDAFALLGGSLLDGQPKILTDALRLVDAVSVHRVSMEPNGLVRAVVTVTRADSKRYRVTHLLRVEPGPPALITEARLLSAQHSPQQ